MSTPNASTTPRWFSWRWGDVSRYVCGVLVGGLGVTFLTTALEQSIDHTTPGDLSHQALVAAAAGVLLAVTGLGVAFLTFLASRRRRGENFKTVLMLTVPPVAVALSLALSLVIAAALAFMPTELNTIIGALLTSGAYVLTRNFWMRVIKRVWAWVWASPRAHS